MKIFISMLLLLALSISAGILLNRDPGYILISYDVWTLEAPLWLALAAILVLMCVISALYNIIKSLVKLPRNLNRKRRRRQLTKAYQVSSLGALALAQGHWHVAERKLIKGVRRSPLALLNYLGAAIAAGAQHQQAKRDEYLRLAHMQSKQADIAIGLVQAKLQYEAEQFEQCVATLERLVQIQPNHPTVLIRLKEVYLSLYDWKSLLKLLKTLSHKKLITSTQADKLYQQAYLALLKALPDSRSDLKLQALWETVPQAYQRNSVLLQVYIPKLLVAGQHDRAEKILRDALKHQWDDKLICLYGKVHSEHLNKQLATAESWLKHREQHAPLLRTLGYLCLQLQLWGKAHHYFAASLEYQPSADAYLALGELNQHMQDQEQSVACFHQGLQLACDQTTPLIVDKSSLTQS